MKRSTRKQIVALAMILGIASSTTFAKGKKLRRTFNRAATGSLSQKFNYRSRGGDRTGATGRSLNQLKPRFETRSTNKIKKPTGPKP